jgi:hypothetical protein
MCEIASGVHSGLSAMTVDDRQRYDRKLTYGKCTVKDSNEEADTVRPPSSILKVSPNKTIARML